MMNQPPAMVAPKKPIATKPRSQTHVTNLPDLPKQNGTPSLIETRSSSIGNGVDRAKPLPGKPRGQTPPKPRPMHPPLSGKLSSGSPPPPPPPRKFNPPTTNGAPVKAINDYSLLEYASVPALGWLHIYNHTPYVNMLPD